MRRRDVALWLWLALPLPVYAQARFAWKDLGNGREELSESGKPALVYNYGPQLKPGAPETSQRCCYIFPVYTPAGVSVLDDAPQGEWHHHGLYWGWPVVEVAGKQYDLWQNMTVQVRRQALATESDPREARMQATNLWEAGGTAIVREYLQLGVTPAKDAAREVEVGLTWTALAGPVTLRGAREPGKSYGGFNACLAPREETVLRADGQTLTQDEDLIPRRWAEMDGVYGGKRAALHITPDPADPGVPYQWCLRKYGFVGASFPGKTESVDGYTLAPGKPLTLKFLVRVSDLK